MTTTDEKSSMKQKCISMASCYNSYLNGLEMFTKITDFRMLPETKADAKLEKSKDSFSNMGMMNFQI